MLQIVLTRLGVSIIGEAVRLELHPDVDHAILTVRDRNIAHASRVHIVNERFVAENFLEAILFLFLFRLDSLLACLLWLFRFLSLNESLRFICLLLYEWFQLFLLLVRDKRLLPFLPLLRSGRHRRFGRVFHGLLSVVFLCFFIFLFYRGFYFLLFEIFYLLLFLLFRLLIGICCFLLCSKILHADINDICRSCRSKRQTAC